MGQGQIILNLDHEPSFRNAIANQPIEVALGLTELSAYCRPAVSFVRALAGVRVL